MGNMRSLNHLIPNCSSDFRNPCWIKTKRASYLDWWIKDGGCMMRSHVRTGCVSWCWSSDPDHVTRAISAHCSSSNIGQCQARLVGSPTVSPHTFSGLSHNTHYKTSGEIKNQKGDVSFQGLLSDYLCWRQNYVIWRPVANLVSPRARQCGVTTSSGEGGQWPRSPGPGGSGDQESRDTRMTGTRSGARLGTGVWTGAWLWTEPPPEPEPVTGSQRPGPRPRLASRAQPLLPTPVSQDTKYSRFFSQVCFEVSLSQGLPTPIHHTSQCVNYRATQEEDTFILS